MDGKGNERKRGRGEIGFETAKQELQQALRQAEEEHRHITEPDESKEHNAWLRRVGWAAHLEELDRRQQSSIEVIRDASGNFCSGWAIGPARDEKEEREEEESDEEIESMSQVQREILRLWMAFWTTHFKTMSTRVD